MYCFSVFLLSGLAVKLSVERPSNERNNKNNCPNHFLK